LISGVDQEGALVRALILVDCYLPSHKSSAKLTHDLGAEFHRRGHDVTILAPSNQMAQDCEVSIEDGLVVARVKTPRIKGASKLLRGIHEARLSSLVWKRAGKFLGDRPSDLIVFYSPTIFWGALVRRLKSLWHCPAYLILRDIFPQWAVDAGVLHRGLIYEYFRRKEIEQYNQANVIAVQSPGDLEYFANNFAQRNYPLEVLYNWTATHEVNLPQTQYRATLGLQDKVVFFYGGSLGVAQDVDNILRLASNLKGRPDIRFLLVGDGTEVPRMRKVMAENNLGNILLLPPIEQREYLSMVSEFDVGLIALDRRLTTHNIPGKLLGYMYKGMPILGSVNHGNDLFTLIEKANAGYCIENGEDESLQEAAIKLASDSQLRLQMGKNARSLLEDRFSAEAAVEQILHSSGIRG
jgi:O26-antigen biosynthesis N-acetyl-L-fucosamine transferase